MIKGSSATEQIFKNYYIDNGKNALLTFSLLHCSGNFQPANSTILLPSALQHFGDVNHVHISSRLRPTSCWPELMELAVDQLLVVSSSPYLSLQGGIVPQQLLSVDKKCVLRLNHQLPRLLIHLHWVTSATNP